MLLKIVTDKTVLDGPFADAMARAWNSDPDTVFRPVSRNCYLVEFVSVEELERASVGGPWTYRGDLVALRQVSSNKDMRAELITTGDLWVQFFNLPVNALTGEGGNILGRLLGEPLTPPTQGFVNGRRFIKQKVRVKIGEPMQDVLPLDHPSLGTLKVHCHYEKVSRICTFCGLLGHEIDTCKDRARLAMLLQKPSQVGKYDAQQVLSPKRGVWMTKFSAIPKPESQEGSSCHKRSFSNTSPGKDHPESMDHLLSSTSRTMVTLPSGIQIKRARLASPNSPARDI